MFLSQLYNGAYMAWHLRGQARYPFRPYEQIRADQSRRVRDIVAYAYVHVPYYRDTMNQLGLTPDDFQTAEDLERLPLLQREWLQRDPEYFVSQERPLSALMMHRNSGSTSRPCTFFNDKHSLFAAAAWGARARAVFAPILGKTFGFRKTMILCPGSTAQLMQEFYAREALVPGGLALKRQYLWETDPIETHVAAMNEFKPDHIHGHGSYLPLLFAHVDGTGVPFHLPRVIQFTGDGLPESARQLIQTKFGIPVFSSYEATEAYNLGFECEAHDGLHINADLFALRIADAEGRTVPDGESGEVVISNLVNHGTVLLNYPLGDLAASIPTPCSCGRTLPRISILFGRIIDHIELPSGRVVHPSLILTLFADDHGIWQWQVVQEEPLRFRVGLLVAEGADRASVERRIAAEFERALGPGVQVTFVDTIERTPAGKVRPVISLRTRPPAETIRLPESTPA